MTLMGNDDELEVLRREADSRGISLLGIRGWLEWILNNLSVGHELGQRIWDYEIAAMEVEDGSRNSLVKIKEKRRQMAERCLTRAGDELELLITHYELLWDECDFDTSGDKDRRILKEVTQVAPQGFFGRGTGRHWP